MIHRINGLVTEVLPDGIVVHAAGLEYKLETSSRCIARHGRRGKEVAILTYLYPREDALFLFGFTDNEERELFLQLKEVSGIGPKAALRILSGISPSEFGLAVSREDVDRLSTIPGVGKKTAQKLVLALSGKLVLDSGERRSAGATAGGAGAGAGTAGFLPDIEAALTEMGFDRRLVAEKLARVVAGYLVGLGREDVEPALYYEDLETEERRRFEEEILLRAIRALS